MSEAKGNGVLTKALLAAQIEMPAVKPDATNPHYRSKFVSLGNLIAKVRPVLNKHGLAFAQFPSSDEQGQPTLVTILMHESGERLEYAAPLFLPKNDPQGQGSAITYMRRYALASALGISDQEDDDGNASAGRGQATAEAPRARAKAPQQTERAASPKQRGYINGLFGKAELTVDETTAVLQWVAGTAHLDRMAAAQASELIEVLGEDGAGAGAMLDEIRDHAADGRRKHHDRAQKIAARYLGGSV
ncbi:MAG: ERF family protein [Thermoanaerobaculia bacterium]